MCCVCGCAVHVCMCGGELMLCSLECVSLAMHAVCGAQLVGGWVPEECRCKID